MTNMAQSRKLIVWAAAAVALLTGATMPAQQSSKRDDDRALKNAAKDGEEWLTYGRDYAETHYSPLKQIDASNVKRLGLAWSMETDSPANSRVEGTPLM